MIWSWLYDMELVYLTKQTVALREVNDSRLRIYEQLEVNIQDLERANHRLAVDNSADKKHIKSLTANIEALELKCEHLQSSIDDLTLQLEVSRRKSQRLSTPVKDTFAGHTRLKRGDKLSNQHDDLGTRPLSPDSSCTHKKYDECVSTTKPDRCQQTQTTPKKEEPDSTESDSKEIEQIAYLMSQLREAHTQCAKDQRRITELQEQLETMQEQSKVLERQLSQYHIKEEEMKSVQDEFSSLEEVRQGQLCSRCLRTVNGDDMSLSACDDDDSSMFEAINERSQHRSSFSMDVQDYTKTSTPTKQGNNLYKDLVQKYEALLEVHRNPTRNQKQVNNCLSLHEELQMSNDFNNLMNTKDTDEESGHGDSLKTEQSQAKKDRKAFSRTPTDFSEAETSSSGFSDETSNKATQTDGRPGSFLCTIADGKDCISIYDDAASPIESRFRNRPEYRELFKEIFSVLKKAAISKEENEDLPLLDDNTQEKNAPTVPPVTPSTDAFPDFPDNATDDTQSILSSTMSQSSASQMDITISENVQGTPPAQKDVKTPVIEQISIISESRETKPKEISLTPLVRQPLEYVSVAVNVRKRSSSRRKKAYNERSDSPVTHIVGSPKVTYSNRHNSGRRRKENRPADVWVGNTKIFYNRSIQSPTPSQDRSNTDGYKYEHALEYKPSPASQELHRLKTLERTYADVLRKSDSKPPHWRRQN
ncbi:hypothetical protein QE152_g15335 [Popillia japonica]|uniref:Cerebellar degeneration-related protein 2-like n=1 Tax=Popillia japonica TaxID=7064 RepID=A0AAW1L608_POPJA